MVDQRIVAEAHFARHWHCQRHEFTRWHPSTSFSPSKRSANLRPMLRHLLRNAASQRPRTTSLQTRIRKCWKPLRCHGGFLDQMSRTCRPLLPCIVQVNPDMPDRCDRGPYLTAVQSGLPVPAHQ
jgi:hypothetical protein